MNRLSHIDRVTGEPLTGYEHPCPGSLIHVDVTTLGDIPDGGGHRYVGRQRGHANRRSSENITRGTDYRALIGTAFVHTDVDDDSRVACTEIHADEKAVTAIGVFERALAWFANRGVTVERVLPDNGSACTSYAWRQACSRLGVRHKRTRPYRPQTSGKIERFHRTLADGWAYARFYSSATERRETRRAGYTSKISTGTTPRSAAAREQTQQPAWTSHLAGPWSPTLASI